MKLRKITREESLQDQEVLPTNPGSLTVSELTNSIRNILESDFSEVVVTGEISGWTVAGSGHRYFTLKDEKAALSCVCWRTRQIGSVIGDGMKVIVVGGITVYPPRGAYQLDCRQIMPLGQGELQLAFERLKSRLLSEGLFDPERKRPLPNFPKRIGVVTSPTGAAIRDILTTLSRRMPTVSVVVAPAKVQGVGSAQEIARGIEQLNELGDIDLIIAGRGGGSIEDLWAFNEEIVARAIAGSNVPVISAVGHEIDFTIADFVADVRAATPTAAAEIAVRSREELVGHLIDTTLRIQRELRRKLDGLSDRLEYLSRSRGLAKPHDLLREYQQQVDELTRRSRHATSQKLQRTSDHLHRLESSLRALAPHAVLRRGYAIVQKDGKPVSSYSELELHDHVNITMWDGEHKAKIVE
ncbi:MAG: exodeoxyribonuclease VII large subunit [Ignavibacteriae bacterium]|nr:exodeoxyribonuclease VII large subunit [Ignavibacteriota bacterium]MCB9216999.1 exodeoxyribonuclease VII large subunit [Ignavibacteria bacterium]